MILNTKYQILTLYAQGCCPGVSESHCCLMMCEPARTWWGVVPNSVTQWSVRTPGVHLVSWQPQPMTTNNDIIQVTQTGCDNLQVDWSLKYIWSVTDERWVQLVMFILWQCYRQSPWQCLRSRWWAGGHWSVMTTVVMVTTVDILWHWNAGSGSHRSWAEPVVASGHGRGDQATSWPAPHTCQPPSSLPLPLPFDQYCLHTWPINSLYPLPVFYQPTNYSITLKDHFIIHRSLSHSFCIYLEICS